MRLPEGWKELTLADICKKSISYGIVQTGDSVQGGILCVRVVDLTKKEISSNEMITTTEEISQSYKKTILEKNEIMFALRGEVGLSRMVDDSLVGANLTRGIARLSPKESIVDPFFLLWAVRSPKFRADLIRRVGGSALQEIGIGELRRVTTYIPPLLEQQKIAQILSAWDKAIENLEALIAAKKKRKKALMQQLLTGKKRFPGFDGEWKEVRFNSVLIGKKCKGKMVPTNNESNGLPYIGAASFDCSFSLYTQAEDAITCAPDDILVLWDGENAGKVATGLSGAVSSTVVRYRLKANKANSEFVAYCLLKDNYKIRAIREGSGIPHMPGDFENWCDLILPPLSEQQKIAPVLSAADQEITTHQNQLAALKQQKKGLMQQLLTGKKRVNVNQVAA